MKYSYILMAIAIALPILILSGCLSRQPENIGFKNGSFYPCPESPNCVSSQASDETHAITPIAVHGNNERVMVDLANAIRAMFGSKIITQKDNYLHAEFTTRIMRFVDDLECHYDEARGIIEVRSASRIGYSDFNANRQRVEELRKLFEGMN